MAVGGGFITVISRCFSDSVHLDVDSRFSAEFLGALDGQQLLVLEDSGRRELRSRCEAWCHRSPSERADSQPQPGHEVLRVGLSEPSSGGDVKLSKKEFFSAKNQATLQSWWTCV